MYMWRMHLGRVAACQTRRIETRHAETQPNPSPSSPPHPPSPGPRSQIVRVQDRRNQVPLHKCITAPCRHGKNGRRGVRRGDGNVVSCRGKKLTNRLRRDIDAVPCLFPGSP